MFDSQFDCLAIELTQYDLVQRRSGYSDGKLYSVKSCNSSSNFEDGAMMYAELCPYVQSGSLNLLNPFGTF